MTQQQKQQQQPRQQLFLKGRTNCSTARTTTATATATWQAQKNFPPLLLKRLMTMMAVLVGRNGTYGNTETRILLSQAT
jgi:hypothetical protein